MAILFFFDDARWSCWVDAAAEIKLVAGTPFLKAGLSFPLRGDGRGETFKRETSIR